MLYGNNNGSRTGSWDDIVPVGECHGVLSVDASMLRVVLHYWNLMVFSCWLFCLSVSYRSA